MTRGLLLSMLMIISCNLSAQFNDSTFYYIRFSSQGMYNQTNDISAFTFNNALNFTINKKKVSLNSSNNWIYGEQDNRLTNNDFASVLNLDLFKDTRRLYYWGLASYTTSYSLKINYQFQAGAGLGLNIINKPDAELVVSNGLLYETSDLQLDTARDIYQTVRNSLRVKHRLTYNAIRWDGTFFWQPSLQDIDDYILRATTTLAVKLKTWLSITGGLTYNKLSRTNRENLLINFGLVAEKYW
jgi:hypothetical protein